VVLWQCTNCSTQYAVGLLRCPRCQAFEYLEEGSIVPKTTLGGPSNADAAPGEVGHIAEEPAAPLADAGADAHAEAVADTEPDGQGAEGDAPARPPSSASRADWVAYVTAAGLDPDEAARMTKKELAAWTPPAPGDLGAELTITAEATVTRGEPEEQGE